MNNPDPWAPPRLPGIPPALQVDAADPVWREVTTAAQRAGLACERRGAA